MTYVALYRKYRPAGFDELVGQEHVARTLANAVIKGNVVHAYLFCGPRGTGKTSVAKILAAAVNCAQPQQGSPCGECASCRRFMNGESMDVMEIDAASNRGIDEIRDLRERVKYAPAQEKHKVYIIDEVHMMTGEAFNALLKTLEEPPEAVIFILATTEPHKIPLTVLSRCQRFDFQRISEDGLKRRLFEIATAEGIAVDEDAVAMIARKAQGGMRDAVGLLDQCAGFSDVGVSVQTVCAVLGTVDGQFISKLADDIMAAALPEVLAAVGELVRSGKDLRQFTYDLIEHLREMLLREISGKKEDKSSRILSVIKLLTESDSRLRYSLDPGLTLELAMIEACGWQPESASFPAVADAAPANRAGGGSVKNVETAKRIEEVKEVVQGQPSSVVNNAEGARDSAASTEGVGTLKNTKEEKTEKIKKPVPEREVAGVKNANETKETEMIAPIASAEKFIIDKNVSEKKPEAKETAPVGIERVCQSWDKIREIIGKESVALRAFLEHARPVSIEGRGGRSLLVLGFAEDYAVHMNNVIERRKNKELLEKIAGEVLNTDILINGILTAMEDVPPEPPPDDGMQGYLFG